jgi:hypothetical protein
MADAVMCRTCGKPRGENIAEGTRCASCGYKQAALVSIAGGVAAASWSMSESLLSPHAVTIVAVAILAVPISTTVAVLLHELVHAAAAALLGQTVTRVVVGEGGALLRIGRDPHFLLGSVVLSNGITFVMDPRMRGYRGRWAATLLAAPAVSALIGWVTWLAATGWTPAPRTAMLVFGGANLLLAALTLIPVPTFGGRVWGDLAVALYLARATDSEIQEHQLLSMQDRVAHLFDAGAPGAAVETARHAARAHPTSALAHSLLAYALHRTGDSHAAADVARAALTLANDESSRAYLTRIIDSIGADGV